MLLYVIPVVLNLALVAWGARELLLVPESDHDFGLHAFAGFYALGGVVMVISGATAVSDIVFGDPARRRLLYVALVNTWVPTLVMLALFVFG